MPRMLGSKACIMGWPLLRAGSFEAVHVIAHRRANPVRGSAPGYLRAAAANNSSHATSLNHDHSDRLPAGAARVLLILTNDRTFVALVKPPPEHSTTSRILAASK